MAAGGRLMPLGPARPWRFVVDALPADGAWNMALDRAMQLECAAGRSPATLRLYTWTRPTITVGRFQALDSVDLDACRADGVDVARRFTGGRGVLHDSELTYSVVASVGDGVPRGTAASYRHLCGALVATYERLGMDAELTSRPRGSSSSGACYLHATHADVSAGAMKLSGSAQVWHRDTVLQHGSFVFSRDVGRESRLFGLTPDETAELAATTATFADLGVDAPDPADLAQLVLEAFEDVFGLGFAPGEPTERERLTAAGLLEETLILDTSRDG